MNTVLENVAEVFETNGILILTLSLLACVVILVVSELHKR